MRRLVRFSVGAAAVVLVLALALVVASRTRPGKEYLRARLLTAVRSAVDGRVDVGRVGGVLGRTLVLEDVRVGIAGRTVARVARVEVVYSLLTLLRGRVRLRRVTLIEPRVRAIRQEGRWRFPGSRAAEHEHEDADGGVPITVDRLEVRGGRVAVALLDAAPPRRFTLAGIEARAALAVATARSSVRIARLHFVPRGIAVTPVDVAGHVVAERDGALQLRDFVLATARSRITGGGRFQRGTRVEGRVALAPLAARELRAVFPDSRLARDIRAEVQANGPWSRVAVALNADLGDGGALTGAARLDLEAEPPAHAARLRFTHLDPGGTVRGLVRARLDGRARTEGRGLGRDQPLTYDLELGPSEVEGRQLDHFTLRGVAAAGVHRTRARLVHPAGTAVARGRVALGPPLAYRLRSRVRIAHLEALVPALPGWGAVRIDVSGREAPERRATLRAALERSALRGVTLERGVVEAELAGERLAIARAEVEGPALRAALSGSLDTAAPAADLRLASTADLRLLGAALGMPLAGAVRAEGTARGPLAALTVAGNAAGDGLAHGTLSAAAASTTFDLTGLGGAAPAGTVRLEAQRFRIGTRPPYAIRAALDWRRTDGTDRAALEAAAKNEDGTASALALTLARSPARTEGELRSLALAVADGPTWRLARPTPFVLDDGVVVPELTLTAGTQEITLRGHLTATGRNDASAALARVELAPYCALLGAPPCAASLSGRAALSGPASAPLLDANLTADGVRVERVEYGTLALTARYAERSATLHAALRHPEAGTLALDGDVPIDLAWQGPRRDTTGMPVSLTLRAEHLDLTFLRTFAPGQLRQCAGRLSVDLRVHGPRGALAADGTVALDDGRLELAAAGVPYEDIRLRLSAAGSALHVTELSARAGDGTLAGEGTLGVAAAAPTELGLTLRLRDFFAVRLAAYEAVASGTLDVRGSVTAPEVGGELEIVRAILRPAALPESGPNLEPDPSITVINNAAPDAAPPAAPPPPPIFERASLAVHVAIARNAWIRRNDANIELGGDLRLAKKTLEPVVVIGRILLLRGWYAFQGRRFDIDSGTITFTGATPPAPTFDVTAVYKTRLYRIEAHIEGTGEKPRLTLSSDPPLEQADILAVILFGKPTHELGKGQSTDLQRQALGLATGYVMPELRTSVMNTLGLDALEVELPQGRDTPGRVSVGRYVAGDIFVSLAQEFGSRTAGVVSVEYGVTPSISLRGSTSSRGESAVDLFWHRRY